MEISLTKLTEEDLDTLHEWYNYPEYEQFFRHLPENMSRNDLVFYLSHVGALIRCDTSDKPMSAVALIIVSPKTKIADVSIMVDKGIRKQGVASELMKKVVHLMFTEGKVDRVTVLVSSPITISALKRGGFFEECRTHKSAFYDGKLHNESRMVLTKAFYNKIMKENL